MSVDGRDIYVLTLDKIIVKIPRYEIIAISTYPLEYLPINHFKNPNKLSMAILKKYKIKTKYKNQIVDLVEGWPIQFSTDKISFLNTKGEEVVIARNNIWKIKSSSTPKNHTFEQRSIFKYKLLHPTSLKGYPQKIYGSKSNKAKLIKVPPAEFLSDSIIIKRKLDVLEEEHQQIKDYEREQKFYPIPQIYINQSTLGFWYNIGSRYGATKSRGNNGSPILVNEFSSGPFGFQHIFYTGSGPNSLLIHEESQTQIFYRFKADYFHMSFFFDPNRLLGGSSNYHWKIKDFKTDGDLQVETSVMDMGFDYGPFSIIFIPLDSIEFGIKNGDSFHRESFNFMRYGIGIQGHFFKAEFIYGKDSKHIYTYSWNSYEEYNEEYDYYEWIFVDNSYYHTYEMEHFRLNTELSLWDKYKVQYSFILKNVGFDETYKSKMTTNAVNVRYDINYKYLIKGMTSMEKHSIDGGKSNWHFKAGINFSIIF